MLCAQFKKDGRDLAKVLQLHTQSKKGESLGTMDRGMEDEWVSEGWSEGEWWVQWVGDGWMEGGESEIFAFQY